MNKALLKIAETSEDNEKIGFSEFKSISFDYKLPRFILDVIWYLSGVSMHKYKGTSPERKSSLKSSLFAPKYNFHDL